MEIITSNYLKQFLEQDKRKFEGLLPELVKKLILSCSPQINTIRMPGRDDVWAPGFDGIVDCQKKTAYVAEGKSVWEFGTSSDTLGKINSDYDKRTADSLGIDTKTATFYLVVPKVWAYGISTAQWEAEHTLASFQDRIRDKMCRVKSSTFVDAYGFCLSALLQDADTANQVVKTL